MEIVTTPMPHQIECVKQIRKFGGNALIADEQGLGKTFESLLWVVEERQWPCVIVCPASLKYNWQAEIRTHLRCRALVLEGRTVPPDARQQLKRFRFIILNFQILQAWLPTLTKLRAKTLILDECQAISNRTTLSYQWFSELREGIPHLLALSGTPLTGLPAQLWPILNLLRPDIWISFFKFAVRYCEPKRNHRGVMEYKGARQLDRLHRKCKKYCMIRRLKTDVLDLPPKVRSVVPIPIINNAIYKEAEKNVAKWLARSKGLSALMRAKKSLSLTKFNHWRMLCIQYKMPAIIDWVKTFLKETDEKLVLMFCHTAPIDLMMKTFGKIAVRVDGKVTSNIRRGEAVRNFQTNPKYRLFVGNEIAAGAGLTLTAAHHLAMCEVGWTSGGIKQAEDRIHRISQEQTAFIYYLVATGTVEESVIRRVTRGDDILNQVLDGGRADSWGVQKLLADKKERKNRKTLREI